MQQFPIPEFATEFPWSQEVLGRPGSGSMSELCQGEGFEQDESPGSDGAPKARPDGPLQVIGADDEVEPVAG